MMMMMMMMMMINISHHHLLLLLVVAFLFSFDDVVRAVAPRDLSNFQGLYSCPTGSSIARVSTVSQLKDVVRDASKVKAIGVGHSW